jgi:NitT/TauT family transport system substrate-binding protein
MILRPTLHALVLSATALLAACGGGAAPSAAPSAPASAAASAKPAVSASAKPATSGEAKPAASASAKPATSGEAKPAASASAKPAPASIAPAKPGQILAAYSEIVTSNLPMWTAKEAGIFQKNGLDVDLRLIESSLVVGALLSGQVQVGGVGGSETLAAAVEGGDLKILATTTPVYPYKLMVTKDIQRPEDLKGKKIGVSRFGSSSDVATRAALKKIGIDPEKDVSILQVGSLSARTAAMMSGAIQGAVANPPDNIRLEKEGFRALVDLAALDLPASNNGIVVQGSWLNSHKAETQKFVDSYIQAIALDKKDKTLAIDVMKKYLKLDDMELLEPTYDYWVGKTMPSLPYAKPEQFTDSINVVAEKNPRAKSYDLNKLLDDTFVKSAADRGLDKG